MHSIYVITNKINYKQYVGQTKNALTRWYDHRRSAASTKPSQIVHKSIKKYGNDNFKFEVIAICKTQEDANLIEEYCIQQYNSLVPNGYNMSKGGNDNPPIQKTANKTSFKTGQPAWNKGIPASEETRQKVSFANKGRKRTVEIILKLSQSHRKLTDEQIILIKADPRSSRKIAADYGVIHTTILKIKNNSRLFQQ